MTTAASYLRRSSGGGVAGRECAHRPRAWSPATGWRSTCRWSPRRSSRCWRALGSARCTASCSRGSRRRRCGHESTTPAAKLVITTDGHTGAGRRCPLKEAVDEALSSRRSSIEHVWSCAAPERDAVEPRAATSGGTSSSMRPPPSTSPRGIRLRAPAVHPLHLRHHRQAEGHRAHHRRLSAQASLTHHSRSSTSSRETTSTGAPPTSAGSPAIATSSTGRCPTAPPS